LLEFLRWWFLFPLPLASTPFWRPRLPN